jgi:DNA polymerase-3 subunit epsilon
MSREIVLDTETTGLDPGAGHRLIELGCVEIVNKFPTGAIFHELIDPERDVPAEAEAIHGISTAKLKGKPKFAQIAGRFLEFIGDSTLVIHNAEFDVKFLNAELDRLGKPGIAMARVVDTLALARRKHPGAPSSLDALCRRYGIDNSNRTKHGALLDSELLAVVYGQLTGGPQAKLELVTRENAARLARSGKDQKPLQRQRPLLPRLTDADRAAHRQFLHKEVKDALWLKAIE